MSDRQYPVGRFVWPEAVSVEQRLGHIETLEKAPARFREAVEQLTPGLLDQPYREGGWTARQVIHHVPESHMNMYIRFKLALTEERPVIKPYDEAAWARLGDVPLASVETSLRLLEALHERWVVLMRSMSESDWKRAFVHPEMGKAVSLETGLCLYAWHGAHHTAHLVQML